MPLQVRVRHALGEKVLALPDRTIEQPLVVGRGREADVVVPAVSVSPRHCLLFVQTGQWAIQQEAGITTLNGQPLSGPKPLRAGDVIGLGGQASVPTILIDTVGVAEGRSGRAAGAATPAKAIEVPPAPPARGAPVSGVYGSIPRRPPLPTPAEFYEATETDADTIDWEAGGALPQPARFYVPKPRRTSGTLVALAMLFGIVVLGGAAVIAYRNYPKLVAPPVIVRQTIADEHPTRRATNNIDVPGQPHAHDQQSAKAATAPSSAGPATSASDNTAGGSGPPESEAGASWAERSLRPPDADSAWDQLEIAHMRPKRQAIAIIQCDEYRRLHPGKYEKELDQYTDDAVNWLWWAYVVHLWDQREELDAAVRQHEQDIKAQPSGPFHDTLVKEKAELQDRWSQVQRELTQDMGYESALPPNLKSPRHLYLLAKLRDPAKYAAFKARVLHYVRDHHGSVWWDSGE